MLFYYCVHEHITCICLSEGRASVHDDCLLFGKVLAQYFDPSFAAPACQGTWGSEDMSSRLNSGHKSANPSTSSPVKARLRCKDGQKLHSLQLLSGIAFGQALTVYYVFYNSTVYRFNGCAASCNCDARWLWHMLSERFPPSTAAPETNFSPVAGGVSPVSPSDLSVSEAWQGIEFGFSILLFGHTA